MGLCRGNCVKVRKLRFFMIYALITPFKSVDKLRKVLYNVYTIKQIREEKRILEVLVNLYFCFSLFCCKKINNFERRMSNRKR